MNIKNLTTSPFPENIRPMSPTLIKEPFDSKDYIFEIKWDGFRCITMVRNNEIKLFSRKGFSFNSKFPSIISCLKGLGTNIIIDGEIVVTDKKGRSDFESLRHYSPSSERKLYYYVFDILYYDKYSLTDMPLIERKKLLKKYLPKESALRFVDHIEKEGKQFFAIAEKTKLEGIIAKKKNSFYIPGVRTRDWLKIKTEYHKKYLQKYPREF